MEKIHTYFGSDARWKTRYVSALQWRQLYKPNELHFIFKLAYLSCHNLEVDELHVMHLGTTMYMLGAILYMLCFHVLDGAPEDIMHGIWSDINEFYNKHTVQTQFSNLKIGSSQDPGQYPSSKAKVQKSKTWLHHWHMCGMQRPEAPLTGATNGSQTCWSTI